MPLVVFCGCRSHRLSAVQSWSGLPCWVYLLSPEIVLRTVTRSECWCRRSRSSPPPFITESCARADEYIIVRSILTGRAPSPLQLTVE